MNEVKPKFKPTPIFTGCNECKGQPREKLPSPGWADNACITCLYNAQMPKTNNFDPINDGKTYA